MLCPPYQSHDDEDDSDYSRINGKQYDHCRHTGYLKCNEFSKHREHISGEIKKVSGSGDQ